MSLEFVFSADTTNTGAKNQGNTTPSWYNNEDNHNTWYYENNDDNDFYYNIVDTLTGENENVKRIYVQYGKNRQGWGSGRFYVQDLQIISEVDNTDGSIDVNLRTRLRSFKQRPTTMATVGYNIIYDIMLLNQKVFNYTGNALDVINQGSSGWINANVNIKPQETYTGASLLFDIYYPNGEVSDKSILMGFGLENTNPLTYVPMAIRKSNSWKDLDSNNGVIEIRKSGQWIDKSNENTETSRVENEGHNRIRKNGKWYQLPKMINGGV